MRFSRLIFAPLLLLALAACDTPTAPSQQPDTSAKPNTKPLFPVARSLRDGKASFERVSKRLLPVAKQACRTVHKGDSVRKCTFRLIVRSERGETPDARFTRSSSGRQIIVFNGAMLQFLRDDDEMAMVLGHEMAHQIADHINRGQREVIRSARSGAAAAKKAGKDPKTAAVKAAETALITYSRQYELEADRAGTILMMRAGYSPDQAINLLDRLPAQNNRFRRHPPHPKRKDAVRAIAKQFRSVTKDGQTMALVF